MGCGYPEVAKDICVTSVLPSQHRQSARNRPGFATTLLERGAEPSLALGYALVGFRSFGQWVGFNDTGASYRYSGHFVDCR
jgi:hypothetical protein